MKTLIRYSGIGLLLIFALLSGCVLAACESPLAAAIEFPSVYTFGLEQHKLQIIESGQRFTMTDRSAAIDTMYAPGAESDLIIESITWSPQNPSKGDTVTISATVKNQGSAMSLPSTVRFYIDGNFRSEQYLDNLGVGGTVGKDFTWIAQQGSHLFRIIADEDDTVAESDETNNEKSVTISSITPDLIVENITWLPVGPIAGDNATFSFVVKNQGTGTATSSHGNFYIDNELQRSVSFNEIESGGISTTTLSWPIKAGVYTVKLKIDPNNKIIESDENNNEKTVDFIPIIPDLFVSSVVWVPTNPSVGETVNFTVTIGNQGRSIVTDCDYYLYIGSVSSDSGSVKDLTIGGSDTEILKWVAVPGNHAIKIVVDPNNRFVETVESNNEVTIGNLLSVRAADLTIDPVTWLPEEASPGDTLTLSIIVRNRGYGDAVSTQLKFYVDGEMLGLSSVSPLPYGGMQIKTFTWIVEEGSHTFRFTADSNNNVSESNEDNNERIAIYPFPPDLIIKDITLLPPEPAESDNITFTIVVENKGDVTAEYFNVAFHIDDIYLGYLSGNPIASGVTDNLTYTWTAELGEHDFRAVADYSDL
ncbi:CARDB domain-containing protein, partial [Chloroflexota bacterium]